MRPLSPIVVSQDNAINIKPIVPCESKEEQIQLEAEQMCIQPIKCMGVLTLW